MLFAYDRKEGKKTKAKQKRKADRGTEEEAGKKKKRGPMRLRDFTVDEAEDEDG